LKTAIILFNLGGPDSLTAVKPFLFNLFNDKNIISAPQPIRFFLAKLISSRREKTAQDIYAHLGGYSPILPQTKAQADALQKKLGENYKVFIAMRYWHPFTEETIAEVKKYSPDKIVLLPLYPQFSTTTTESSILEWDKQAKKAGLSIPTEKIGCYWDNEGWIDSLANLVKKHYDAAVTKYGTAPRILFSAHGLPEKIVKKGDPYQWQVEQTCQKIADKIGADKEWITCYQSKVGPLEWIKPATEAEIIRAGAEKKPLLIVPVAFVSEHSETLVELDIEYKHLAEKHEVPYYERVPTVGINEEFISGLAELVLQKFVRLEKCPMEFEQCICRKIEKNG